jgi:nucleolar protein 58
MIVQAIALLDDLDKELNTYAMRVKEWYGWHFPEMGRIVNDNLAYAKIIMAMGMRTNAANSDLSDVLPEEIETAVKAAAEVSMGTEITQEDLDNIQMLADQVINFTEYRAQLSSYLSARMTAIAPNLTALVGDLVGARLIAHAGSLMNLAKSPASTIQILGAEKALFRALKTKHDTPKYGLIYHASLIGQATGKNKGKIARVLAAKAAIGIRVDALADWSAEGEGKGDDATEEEKSALGIESRLKIERRLAALEGRPIRGKGTAIAPNANNTPLQPGKWEVKEARKYNPDADGLVGDESAAAAPKQLNGKKESKKLVQQVEDDSDEQMEEVDAKDAAEEDSDEDEDESDDKPNSNGHTNGAASDVSADSPDEEIPEFKSTIVGDDKAAKKARKKELKAHEAKLEADKAAKEARRADRAQRRKAKAEKLAKKSKSSEPSVEVLAAMAGLSIERYQRKLARGEIKFENGKPVSISKKDIKKERKAAEKAASSNGDSKKRKHADEEKSEKAEKKHKKKHRAD